MYIVHEIYEDKLYMYNFLCKCNYKCTNTYVHKCTKIAPYLCGTKYLSMYVQSYICTTSYVTVHKCTNTYVQRLKGDRSAPCVQIQSCICTTSNVTINVQIHMYKYIKVTGSDHISVTINIYLCMYKVIYVQLHM